MTFHGRVICRRAVNAAVSTSSQLRRSLIELCHRVNGGLGRPEMMKLETVKRSQKPNRIKVEMSGKN